MKTAQCLNGHEHSINVIICIHHRVALSARIFLTISRQASLLSIAFGRSSGLHPLSTQSCRM